MQSTLKMWNDFLQLNWWQKFLLFLPFLMLIIITLMLGKWINARNDSVNTELFKENEKLIDEKVKSWEEKSKTEKNKRAELEEKRKTIRQKIEENRKENEEIIKRIDRAGDANELLVLAEELREKQRERTRARADSRYRVGDRNSKKNLSGNQPGLGTTKRKDSTIQW